MCSAAADKSMAVTQQWQKVIYPLKSFKTAYFIVHMINMRFCFLLQPKIGTKHDGHNFQKMTPVLDALQSHFDLLFRLPYTFRFFFFRADVKMFWRNYISLAAEIYPWLICCMSIKGLLNIAEGHLPWQLRLFNDQFCFSIHTTSLSEDMSLWDVNTVIAPSDHMVADATRVKRMCMKNTG